MSAKHLTAGLAIALAATVTGAMPASASARHVLVVKPGQSIQAALDAAKPGDTVLVRPGTYYENLEITTDDVTLIGDHATVDPPAVSQPRRCSTSLGLTTNPFGLCVTGELQNGLPPKVLRRVEGVTIKGLTIGKFPSTGIMTLGADHVTIEDSAATGGTDYGVLLSQTDNGTVLRDRITGGDEAGIYVGDSPKAHTRVLDNDVSDSGVFAIFIRDSTEGVIAGNRSVHSCTGIGFIPTTPAVDTVSDWLVTRNTVDNNDEVCPPPDEGGPTFSGVGILLAGTDRVTVTHNRVDGNQPAPGITPIWSGGIVFVSGADFGGPVGTTDNVVAHNEVHGNHVADINIVDPGTGDRIFANRCDTSNPAGLC